MDIGNAEQVSLFGGDENAAAICDKGEIIFINGSALIKSPKSPLKAVFLPENQKPLSIACLNHFVVVLTTKGKLFTSTVEPESNELEFYPVSELNNYEIVWVSGTERHCFAVTKEGIVFGRESNRYGELGLSKEKKFVHIFREILSLSKYKIKSAYAGYSHSLFVTKEGKVLACGANEHGQLLLSSDPTENNFDFPTETTIKEGATFCIAGNNLSVVFVGGDPPPNTPNMPLQQHE